MAGLGFKEEPGLLLQPTTVKMLCRDFHWVCFHTLHSGNVSDGGPLSAASTMALSMTVGMLCHLALAATILLQLHKRTGLPVPASTVPLVCTLSVLMCPYTPQR